MTNHNLRKNVTYMLTENLRYIILYNIYYNMEFLDKTYKIIVLLLLLYILSFIVKLDTIFPDIIIMLDLA
jgi:hypothetical protein